MIWVFIDLSYLAHRARHSLSWMEHEDCPTGVLYGFWEQLRTICRDPRVNSNKIVLFTDSKKSYRKKAYPSYKAQRRKKITEDERERIHIMWDQVKLLQRKILPDVGVPVKRQVGLESDDLMAWAAAQLRGPNRKAVLITSDGDLYQCITDAVHWYDPGRVSYHTPRTFECVKGCQPELWGEVKTLAGCSSDGVAGIPGVGEKTAVRYLQGKLPQRYKSYQAIVSQRGRRIAARNRQLVVLPHSKTRSFELARPKYDADAFFHYCERYGMASYLKGKTRNGWNVFFKGPRRMRGRHG